MVQIEAVVPMATANVKEAYTRRELLNDRKTLALSGSAPRLIESSRVVRAGDVEGL